MRSATRRLALTLIAPAFGCYEYNATTIGSIRPNETVHVELSPSGSASLASTIGPNATMLDGRVLAIDSNRLRLAVTQIARSVGPEQFLKDEPIDVPRASTTIVTVRSVDRPRTLLAIGGLALGLLVARIVANDPTVAVSRSGPMSGTK